VNIKNSHNTLGRCHVFRLFLLPPPYIFIPLLSKFWLVSFLGLYNVEVKNIF